MEGDFLGDVECPYPPTKQIKTTVGQVSIFPEELSPSVNNILSGRQAYTDGWTDRHGSTLYYTTFIIAALPTNMVVLISV